MKGIKLVMKKNLPLRLKSTVMTLNRHEIPEIKQLAEELKVDYRFDTTIIPRIDGSKRPINLRISPNDVVKLDILDKDRMIEWKNYSPQTYTKFQPKSDSIYPCTANIDQSFWIDGYGNISLCHTSRSPGYNLRKYTFQEARNKLISKVYSMKPTRSTKCSLCTLRAYCECCPGLSFLEYGDPETPIEYNCYITNKRAEVYLKINKQKEK
jgi:radical SAM protein with 4Fe4S-binding SPASM domain